jgi:hypothetical protein
VGLVLAVLLGVVLGIFGAGYVTGSAITRRRTRHGERGTQALAVAYDQGYRSGAAAAGAWAGGVPGASAGAAGQRPGSQVPGAADPHAGPAGQRPGSQVPGAADPYAQAAGQRRDPQVPVIPGPYGAIPGPWSVPQYPDAPAPTSGPPVGPEDAATPFVTDGRSTVPPGETLRPPPSYGAHVPPAPSAEERAAQRAARELRNINIALYSASLLLVAAGGLFIGAAVPGAAKAVTIGVVVALFYASGLVLYTRLPRLRPAAVAFTGTGLALLPVAGLLFGVLTGQGASAWFATALVGTVAYVAAAVRLQSRVVAFLALPFFLSIALSSVSLLGGALVWYFTCSIGVAAVLAVLLRLAPRSLPAVISRAVVDTHRLLAPTALVASLLLGGLLTTADRAQLWVVATAYYAALLAFFELSRIQHFYALRLVGSIATVLVAWAAGCSTPWGALILAVCLALQVVVLLGARDRIRNFPASAPLPSAEEPAQDPDRRGGASRYALDVVVTFSVMALVAAAVVLSSVVLTGAGSTGSPDALLPMLLVLVTGMTIALRCAGAFEALVLPGVVLSAVTHWDDPWRTETVLALTAIHLLVRGLRSAGLRRERFMLAARAVVTALAPVAVLVHVPSPAVPDGRVGEIAGLALVVALAVNQLVEALRSRRHPGSGYGSWVVCVAGGASLLSVVALAAGAGTFALAAIGIWSCVLAGCVTSLILPLAGVTSPAGSPAGGADPGRPAAPGAVVEALGPASLLAAAMAGAAAGFGIHSYEVLLVVGVAYGALLAWRAPGRTRRGAYLLAAQLCFTVLTATISADLELTVHGVFATIAASVALQEVVRVLLRSRLRQAGLQGSSAWLSVGVLAVLPLAYLALGNPRAQLDVIVLHLALLGAVSSVLFLVQRMDAAAYPALYAVVSLIALLTGVLPTGRAGLLPGAPLSEPIAALVAVACAVAFVVIRLRSSAARFRRPARVGAGVFVLEAILFAFEDGAGWDRVVVAAVVAGACFVLARREAPAVLDAGGAVAVIIAATAFVEQVDHATGRVLDTDVLRLLCGAVLAAAVLHLTRVFLPGEDERGLRYRILGATALGWTAIAAVLAMPADSSAVAGSVALTAVAALARGEVPARVRALCCEAAFLVVVLCAQRVAGLLLDGIDVFWAAQWWAVALALLTAWSFTRGTRARGTRWLTASAAILSATGLTTVAGGTTGEQVWALCGHVVLLLAGVALSRRRFSLWGAIGIALALLWFLRGFTFLLLTVAALLLLGFAVWKLNRQSQGPTSAPDTGVPMAPSGPASSGPASSGPAPGPGTGVGGPQVQLPPEGRLTPPS